MGQGSAQHSWTTCSKLGVGPIALFSGSLMLHTCCTEELCFCWPQFSKVGFPVKHFIGVRQRCLYSHVHDSSNSMEHHAAGDEVLTGAKSMCVPAGAKQ